MGVVVFAGNGDGPEHAVRSGGIKYGDGGERFRAIPGNLIERGLNDILCFGCSC